QGPVPLGPRQTAQAAQSSRALSIASCQGSPGMRFHLSSQGLNPRLVRMRARASTTGLSGVACERKTSYLGFSKTPLPRSGQAARFLRSTYFTVWGVGEQLSKAGE